MALLFNHLTLNQPLDQFEVFALNGIVSKALYNMFFNDQLIIYILNNSLFISNIVIYLFYILFIVIFLFNILIINKIQIFECSLMKFLLENFFYIFILNVFISQVGKRGKEFFPYLNTLFLFILFSNFLGLLPSSFTITSHIIVTFLLGGFSILGLTILGFLNQKLEFLKLFIPSGVPTVLLPLLIAIEVISYIARGFSLSIRLFANLMSGHALLHILLFFIVKIIAFNYKAGSFSIALISAIFLLEVGISFLQAYVFIVLISIYFKDSYEVSH